VGVADCWACTEALEQPATEASVAAHAANFHAEFDFI
jgi:hypothetical protein